MYVCMYVYVFINVASQARPHDAAVRLLVQPGRHDQPGEGLLYISIHSFMYLYISL